jgi:hypothetical protein
MAMLGRRWFQPPRRVLTSLLAVVAACVGALGWLGYRMLEQDRALELQRVQDRLESAADLAAATLDRTLTSLQKILPAVPASAGLPDAAIVILARAGDPEIKSSRPLLFYPQLEAPRIPADGGLRRAEVIEFQENNPQAAAAFFRDAARSQEPAVRAAALLGLGRSLRKAGRTRDALQASGADQSGTAPGVR